MSSTPPEAEGSQTSQPARPASSETRKGTGVYLPNAARLSPGASPATAGAAKHCSSTQQRTATQQQQVLQAADKEPHKQNQQQRQRQHKRPSSSCEIQRQHSANTQVPGRPASALAVVHNPHQEWQQEQHGKDEASGGVKPQQGFVLQAGLEQQSFTRAAAAGKAPPFGSAGLMSSAAAAALRGSADRRLFSLELQRHGSLDAANSAHALLSEDGVGNAADLLVMQQQQQQGNAGSSPATNLVQLQQQLQLQQLLQQQQQQNLVAASQRASMQAAAAVPGAGQASTGASDFSDLRHKALPLLSHNTAGAGGAATTQQSNELLAASLLALCQQGVDTRQLFGNNTASTDFRSYATPVVQQLQQRLHMQQQQVWGQLQSVPEHPFNISGDVISSGELPLQGLHSPSWANATAAAAAATAAVAAAAVDAAGDNVRHIGQQTVTLLQLQQLRRQQEQQQHIIAEEAAVLGPTAINREHSLQQQQHMRRQQEQQQQQQPQQADVAASSLFSSSQERMLLPQGQLHQQQQQQQQGGSVDIAASSLFSSSQERMLVPQQQQQQRGCFVDISAPALFMNSQEHMLLQQEQLRQQQQQQTSAEVVPMMGPPAARDDQVLLQLQQLQQLQQQQQPGGPANVQQALNVIDGEINRLMQLRLTPGNAAGGAAAPAAAAGMSYEQAWQQQMVAARAAVRAAANAANPPAAAAPAVAVVPAQPCAGTSSNRSSMDSTFPYAMQRNSMDSEWFAMPSSSISSMEVASGPYALQHSNRNSLDMLQGRGSIDMQYNSRGSIDMQYNSRGSLDMLSPYGAVGPQFAAVQQQQQLQQMLLQQQQFSGGVNQVVNMEDIQARLLELHEADDMKKRVEDQLMQFLPM